MHGGDNIYFGMEAVSLYNYEKYFKLASSRYQKCYFITKH